MPKIDNMVGLFGELKFKKPSFFTRLRLLFVKKQVGWDGSIPGYYLTFKVLDGKYYFLKDRGIY